MRSWKRRTRARYKREEYLWLNSEHSKNYNPHIRTRRQRSKLLESRERKLHDWIRKELKTKTHFEDCNYHPCVITDICIEDDHIEGVSLVSGGSSACSLTLCGVVFFTKEEAERKAAYYKEHGQDRYFDHYKDV